MNNIQKLSQIYNVLNQIEIKGSSAINLASALVSLNEVIRDMANEQQTQEQELVME